MTETHKSHRCCFEQGDNPACGLKGIHRCCLCEKEVPDAKPEWQEKIRTICSYHTDDGTSGYCLSEEHTCGREITPEEIKHAEELGLPIAYGDFCDPKEIES